MSSVNIIAFLENLNIFVLVAAFFRNSTSNHYEKRGDYNIAWTYSVAQRKIAEQCEVCLGVYYFFLCFLFNDCFFRNLDLSA
jgi:hypothetical protein